jgi:signal transduction histidine kinase
MEATFSRLGHRLALDWPLAGAAFCALAVMWALVRRSRLHASERMRDRRVLREMEAYAALDVHVPEGGDVRGLGIKVCRVVAEVSAFRIAAMMTRDAEGRLFVVGSVGMDDLTVEALNRWGARAGVGGVRAGMRAGVRSGAWAVLGLKAGTRSFVLELDGGWVGMAPLWTTGGRMLGVVAVCGDDVGAMAPIEGLVAKLARTMENAALVERLLRSEKLAGLGQLAGGVAHALNNPLTAVMGFAELIGETAGDVRVREDAAVIVREAARMRETVQSLLDLWRPATLIDEAVSLTGMVEELAAACFDALEARGVRLVVEIAEDVAAVRGSRERLRQVMEHLLNNAAQAVASVSGEEHLIRVAVRQDERGVQMIVSDTGPGFAEPARVFDPFYVRQHVGEGAGLGLSICYGIVREHGGEISAFNLHPRGAGVVVELPVGAHAGCGLLVDPPPPVFCANYSNHGG